MENLTQEELEQVAGGLTSNSGTTTPAPAPAADATDPMPNRGF